LALQIGRAFGALALAILNALVGQIAPGDQGRLWARINYASLVIKLAAATKIWINGTVEIVGGIVTAGDGQSTVGCQVNLLLAFLRLRVASVNHTFHRGASL
jgi:hypothetical protein